MKYSDPLFDGETAVWSKSSYSTGSANCVEVGDLGATTGLRDTQYRELGVLFFSAPEWQAFLGTARSDFS
ncbi:DUF397 domain-containing protein [Nocardiopsis kunsanensis]|uniref:DUF397 domain-containing protein n=1 Tax=Nocardiopsis kunsanensis TaxID=141693 RepID=UPI00034DBF1B|nr:DUF397 domain-containing protein [Nocardiopsis kunsanensis]